MIKKSKADIREFMMKLSAVHPEEYDQGFENPYSKTNSLQYYNLEQYLLFMAEYRPKVMFVGEAPGYKGCQLTGIPFVSEVELKNKANEFALGAWERKAEQKEEVENSAKCIWEALRKRREKKEFVPLIWNAFPYHPYQENNVSSNRAPSLKELKLGLAFIGDLMRIYDIDWPNIYAVGRKAQDILGVDQEHYIRHPSFGGKAKCAEFIINHDF